MPVRCSGEPSAKSIRNVKAEARFWMWPLEYGGYNVND